MAARALWTGIAGGTSYGAAEDIIADAEACWRQQVLHLCASTRHAKKGVYPDLPKGMWCRLGRLQGALLCRREAGSRLAEGHPKGMALTRAHVVPTLADGLSARLLGRQA